MEYIYLDCENIAPRALEILDADQRVFLFLGEKPKKPDWGLTESIKASGDKIEIIHIAGQGNNALDFHIAYHLGRHAHADPKASFIIVSKDKGFDPLVKHLGNAGLACKRMERMPSASGMRTDISRHADRFIAHLEGLAAKSRPKKPVKLKAYLGNWLGKDKALAGDVYERLLTLKAVGESGGKLIYPPSPPDPNSPFTIP